MEKLYEAMTESESQSDSPSNLSNGSPVWYTLTVEDTTIQLHSNPPNPQQGLSADEAASRLQ